MPHPGTFVFLKIFPTVERAGSNPVGTVPQEGLWSQSVNWPHPAFPLALYTGSEQ